MSRLLHVGNRRVASPAATPSSPTHRPAASPAESSAASPAERSTPSILPYQSPTRSPIPFTFQKDCPVGNPAPEENKEAKRLSLSLSLEHSVELFPQPVPATSPHNKTK